MFGIKKSFEIAGSHCLCLDYPSKCTNIHGHNWWITVFCRQPNLNHNGMVTDFTEIKKKISDKLDHKHLNDVFVQEEAIRDNPTAENIAKWICDQIPGCYRVEVTESKGNMAWYERDF